MRLTDTTRRLVIRALRITSSKAPLFPMSEYDALTKALRRIRRLEKAGMTWESTTEYHHAINHEITAIVNDKRYW